MSGGFFLLVVEICELYKHWRRITRSIESSVLCDLILFGCECGWVGAWVDGRFGGWVYMHIHIHIYVYVCIVYVCICIFIGI